MRTIDLFAGCGGMSLGFQRAGFDILAAFDNWLPAIEVYQKNFKHPIHNVDLSQDVNYEMFTKYAPEIIIGGSPCQDFSSAGKRDESLGRASLTIMFAEIIQAVKPKWFVMENVSTAQKSLTLKSAIEILQKSGYGLTIKVIDASYCRVPQSRKRLFVIGELQGKDGALDHFLIKDFAEKPMTVYDYLGNDLETEFYYRHPRSYQRRGIFNVHEPSPTIRGVNRPIPKNYKKHMGDACEPNDNVRPLTTIERSYLQTFPRKFDFLLEKNSKSDLEQMIGNAVPVNLAEYVGNSLMEYIKFEKVRGHEILPLCSKDLHLSKVF